MARLSRYCMGNMKRISHFLPLLALVACYNYGLDDRIRSAISGSGALTLTAPASQFILIQNKSLTMASLQFTATGGNQPYSFSFTQSNLPSNFIVSISTNGLITLTRNTSVGYPATIQTSDPLSVGSISVKVTDASGTNQEVMYPINVHFKRAFITSVQDGVGFSTWSGSFSVCANASPIAAANCACQNRAAAASRLNANKYRAWLSYSIPIVHARCNIANNPSLDCASVNASDGGPWYTTMGSRLADDIGTGATGLIGPTPLQNPLNKDEFGNTPAFEAFTGTDGPGTGTGADCANWTTGSSCGTRGTMNSIVAPTWTNGGNNTGNSGLYCFESD